MFRSTVLCLMLVFHSTAQHCTPGCEVLRNESKLTLHNAIKKAGLQDKTPPATSPTERTTANLIQGAVVAHWSESHLSKSATVCIFVELASPDVNKTATQEVTI